VNIRVRIYRDDIDDPELDRRRPTTAPSFYRVLFGVHPERRVGDPLTLPRSSELLTLEQAVAVAAGEPGSLVVDQHFCRLIARTDVLGQVRSFAAATRLEAKATRLEATRRGKSRRRANASSDVSPGTAK
jgi:hypothetical protein